MKKYKIIIAVLLLSNVISFGLYYKNRDVIDNYENPFPLVDLSRNFIPQEDFIVNLQPLRNRLAEISNEFGSENVAYYIEFLNTGANIAYNPDGRFYPASLVKLPVAIAAARKVQDREWNWDSELVLFKEDVDPGYGTLYKEPVGTRVTIEKLLEHMLVYSDNTAHAMLSRNLGAGEIEKYINDTGLDELFDQHENITAKEYTRIPRTLYTSNYLSRVHSQKILEYMAQAEGDLFLDRGIPDDVAFAHKIGENAEENIYADSGIVYIPNRPYVITVLIRSEAGKGKAEELLEKFGKETYEFFKNVQE